MIQQLPRRERERLMRRQEIIDAARIVFARKGFSTATLDDVAERAEFGKGTLYNYFTNKEALFASVVEDSFQQIQAIAESALSGDRPFEEKIEEFVRGELFYFFRNPESLHLMMRESHHLRGGNPMMQLFPQLLSMLGETIAAEQKRQRVIAIAEPMELATILINMIFGQFMSRVYGTICRAMANGDQQLADECNVADIFRDLSEETIDRDVAQATRLIHTVYFKGILQ
jgi:AcrR family transcriptional regulator